MFLYGNTRGFLIKFLLGMVMCGFSIFLFLSLYSYSPNDYGFGVASNLKTFQNMLGIYGAYTSSLLMIFFNLSSYLFSLFFFIHGTKFILGIPNNYFLFKFLIFIFAIVLVNFSLSIIEKGEGIFGEFLKNFFYSYFGNYFNNYFVVVLFVILILTISLLLFYFSFGIKIGSKKENKFLNKINLIKPVFILIAFIFRKIFSKSFIKKEKITSFLKKTEPTISKNQRIKPNTNKYKYSTLNKSHGIKYSLPPLSLLNISDGKNKFQRETDRINSEFAKKLEVVLKEYGVDGNVTNFKYGPVVTLYEFLPAAGIKTSKIVGLADDIARAMSSLSARISSQPGKNSIGIEIPNSKRESVLLGDLINDSQFTSSDGLTLALGKNISGEKKYTDLEKMPHLLIAGTTGSGKSVGINSMIVSLLYRFTPSECKLILVDPKMLELSIYEDIPHLLTPVVTNPNKAVFALKWVVREMENRYRLMSSLNVKNIISFNTKIKSAKSTGRKLYREVQTGIDKDTRMPIIEKKEIPLDSMPLIVVVIDEMADLMMVAGKEVENLVQRLAQMARASGIHIIAATQRPSVDVITGTIKANFPSRISFRVASRFDSRTILNEMGAEQLLGSGDMLFLENGSNLTRVHGGFVSEAEIEKVVNHIKSQSNFSPLKDITVEEELPNNESVFDFSNNNKDELYEKAVSLIIEQQKVSTSFVQRYLQIGYNRAARIVEKMEEDGYISEPGHSGKRIVLKKNK